MVDADLEPPLWIDTHTPSLEDIPQDDVQAYLQEATDSPLNLFIHGPKGAGKTAAVDALLDEVHDSENDVLRVNAADFFNMSKKELANDPRFTHFIDSKRRRNTSKAGLMIHVVKELSANQPVGGTFKTVVLDNATSMRRDFQQALRRVMERHHETTQFIIIARSASGTIPAIKSRCFTLPMRAPTKNEVTDVLETITTAEDVTTEDSVLPFIASYANHDLREAILTLQLAAQTADPVTPQVVADEVDEIGLEEDAKDALGDAKAGNIKDARKTVDDLLIDEELTGREVLKLLLTGVRTGHEYGPEATTDLVEVAGEIDAQLDAGTSDRTHIVNFLTEVHHATA
ncbi:AAA family ATPase [Salinibaculum rarum]|uniref:AAA family ATPase n=1 Tax=Salinibaculum rarum TaxID=3058903 RepID=UPI00265DE1C6|nr:AAA family ATPase [Salinibaculum sp. KK48]